MPKLFAVLLGGRAESCNIELHDVVVIISDTLENAYPHLINKWFGIHKRLHIDSSVELSNVDGYKITISKEIKKNNNKNLYFVNFGGYKKNFFGELHEMNFYVCESKNEAIIRAKKDLCNSYLQQHCDDNIDIQNILSPDIDDLIELNSIDQYQLHFDKSNENCELKIISEYRRLDIPDIVNKSVKLKELKNLAG